ncbi:MAG TPA: hypothetical protein VI318_01870 [Baekduia sp.]
MRPDIPPDRRSTHELYEQFRAAGVRKTRVQRQRQRRVAGSGGWARHVPGPALGAIAAFLAVGGGLAVGTRVFVSDDGSAVRGDGSPGHDITRAPGDRRVAQATAVDPEVADARWGIRAYTNDQGATCLIAGRLLGGRVGRVVDGHFEEYPDDAVSVCNDLSAEHIATVKRPDTIDNHARVLLFGLVDRTVTGLSYGPRDALKPLTVAPDGSYLVAGIGTHPFAGQVLQVSRGAATKEYLLQPPTS